MRIKLGKLGWEYRTPKYRCMYKDLYKKGFGIRYINGMPDLLSNLFAIMFIINPRFEWVNVLLGTE